MITKPTIYIVDDDPSLVQALCALFATVALPTRTFPNGLSFLQSYMPNWQGCIILDIHMSGMNGLEVQQQLIAKNSTLPLIFISGGADIPMAVNALRAGAIDLVVKPFNNQELLDKVQDALKRERAQHEQLPNPSIQANYNALTPREREVCELIVEGLLNKQIAATLAIGASTVEAHRARVMQKMQVKSLAELIKCYLSIHPKHTSSI